MLQEPPIRLSGGSALWADGAGHLSVSRRENSPGHKTLLPDPTKLPSPCGAYLVDGGSETGRHWRSYARTEGRTIPSGKVSQKRRHFCACVLNFGTQLNYELSSVEIMLCACTVRSADQIR